MYHEVRSFYLSNTLGGQIGENAPTGFKKYDGVTFYMNKQITNKIPSILIFALLRFQLQSRCMYQKPNPIASARSNRENTLFPTRASCRQQLPSHVGSTCLVYNIIK